MILNLKHQEQDECKINRTYGPQVLRKRQTQEKKRTRERNKRLRELRRTIENYLATARAFSVPFSSAPAPLPAVLYETDAVTTMISL